MLDSATRKRIDDCRDILVGKLPDPKAQIEQITIALIYKFMDDMDKEAMELGAAAKFFSGPFEKYSWDKLFDARVTAYEMLSLYSDAISSMDKNPNIPQLFRDIFKNAFLPYRDPETLKLFLKTIGEFKYTHSEKLGDAFEYLLSVMGSQGDAGQFRTPRHIIDFLTAIVDPQKTDTILDPACGTAGFLISAFKYLMQNGQGLTPDERRRIIGNFRGYDISPDMVRLSLVNLYLHGFPDPHIFEYDTLTSEERWNETFDVILANPPFMSPKGGIRPHKKFSVSSNRSEVLFVDYIAEHLNPGGRAGIIVPEGIIFQSGSAYKELRKMLVDNYLYAVVSLPAGVFNPYSGVKTSILLLDKEFAKTNDEILFVKIDNDGFGLGAQRNSVKGSQLEQAIALLHAFKAGNLDNAQAERSRSLAHSVPKAEIAKNGDYNLSGERYRVITTQFGQNLDFVKLSEIVKLSSGNGLTTEKIKDGKFPVYGGNGIIGWHNEYLIENPTIVIGRVGAYCGSIHLTQPFSWVTDNGLYVTEIIKDEVNQIFLSLMLKKLNLNRFAKVGGQPSISQSTVKEQKIPLPPLSVQEEIVAEIEGYQKIIDGARMVVENYRPRIDIDPDWEMVELGEVFHKVNESVLPENIESNSINYIGLENIGQNSGLLVGQYKVNPKEIKSTKIVFEKGDILYGKLRPNLNKVYYSEIEGVCSTDIFVIRGKGSVAPKFYSYYFLSEFFNQEVLKGLKGAQLPRVGYDSFSKILIPLPSFDIQHQIVARIEKEQELVNASKQLISLFEQKIKDRIARVWGEEKGVAEPGMMMAAEEQVEYKAGK